ncbi:MAG: 3-phosphoshikimate 1-carboxyvinyltransferase [Clostridia bacterium]|jgi:3-phosphoshikimate 1-carboxyvinyltransferase|nr:3-phosphoshikimate 1-carboxyvinyltransferase [Clostridia bacterium]
MRLEIKPASQLNGVISVPGDKSISHRAVMLGALSRGMTEIEGFLKGRDCLSTIRCMRALGVPITVSGETVSVHGQGLHGLKEPENILNVGNSGTTLRLLTGILAGQPFAATLTGDASIRRRPMGRVVKPLSEMGAVFLGRQNNTLAPFSIHGGALKPLRYEMPVASAQVKSSLLLAGLYTNGWTEVVEPQSSRNHTELMLSSFGAPVATCGNTVRVQGGRELTAQKVVVPGDISSAAFFLVAGLIIPDSRLVIQSVGLNPTRDGIISVLRAMGGCIKVNNLRTIAGEPIGDLEVETSELHGISIGGALIPRLIDEIPVLAVAALFAQGKTEIRDAAELKVKESNRLRTVCEGLTRLGGRVEELPDGLRVEGGYPLSGAVCESYHDHRIAMALAIAALGARGTTVIEDAEAIEISFPSFTEILARIAATE